MNSFSALSRLHDGISGRQEWSPIPAGLGKAAEVNLIHSSAAAARRKGQHSTGQRPKVCDSSVAAEPFSHAGTPKGAFSCGLHSYKRALSHLVLLQPTHSTRSLSIQNGVHTNYSLISPKHPTAAHIPIVLLRLRLASDNSRHTNLPACFVLLLTNELAFPTQKYVFHLLALELAHFSV
jgi:hypothetical protein